MRRVLCGLLIVGCVLVRGVPAKDIDGPIDQFGLPFKLSSWGEDRLVVVAFLGVDCPLAQLYANRLVELYAQYANRGVCFIAVDANQQDTHEEMAAFAERLPFSMLHDPTGEVADEFAATRTPEVVLLNAGRDVIYRGRIDDQYAPGLHSRPAPSRRDLEIAIEEALSSRPVSVPETEPVGCRIDRPQTAGAGPTYAEDIAAIFDAHCVGCHRVGGIGPFSLAAYEDTIGWGGTIAEVVEQHRMPPWGREGGHFANDPTLTSHEQDLILAWIDGGTPPGDPARRPTPPEFPADWSIEPDLVFTGPAFTVPAEGVLDYQDFVIDPGLSQDAWIEAVEIRPSNPPVVHHATVYLKPKDAEPGHFFFDEANDHFLAMFVPGNTATTLPPGMAKLFPGGWNLVLSIHYVPNGVAQTDQTRIGIKLAGEVTHRVATDLLADQQLVIQPGEIKRATVRKRLDDDALLIALYPHMHLRGRSMLFVAEYPDGRIEKLLKVPEYDFEWQHRYVLADAKPLPAGTVLRCDAVFDNSPNNPPNPDPGAVVHAGDATTDEMFLGAFELARPVRRPAHRLVYLWSALAIGAVFVVSRRVKLARREHTAAEPRGGQPHRGDTAGR